MFKFKSNFSKEKKETTNRPKVVVTTAPLVNQIDLAPARKDEDICVSVGKLKPGILFDNYYPIYMDNGPTGEVVNVDTPDGMDMMFRINSEIYQNTVDSFRHVDDINEDILMMYDDTIADIRNMNNRIIYDRFIANLDNIYKNFLAKFVGHFGCLNKYLNAHGGRLAGTVSLSYLQTTIDSAIRLNMNDRRAIIENGVLYNNIMSVVNSIGVTIYHNIRTNFINNIVMHSIDIANDKDPNCRLNENDIQQFMNRFETCFSGMMYDFSYEATIFTENFARLLMEVIPDNIPVIDYSNCTDK